MPTWNLSLLIQLIFSEFVLTDLLYVIIMATKYYGWNNVYLLLMSSMQIIACSPVTGIMTNASVSDMYTIFVLNC